MDTIFERVNAECLQPLKSFRWGYFIDVSGSTSGSVLKHETTSAMKLTSFLPSTRLVTWSTSARETEWARLNDIPSGGGTEPKSFVQFMKSLTGIVVYTDGQISKSDMAMFKNELSNASIAVGMPIIIVLTTADTYDTTLLKFQRNVDMSIPEGFLGMSNDVLILVTSACCTTNVTYKVLFGKGEFSTFDKTKGDFNDTTTLHDLAEFDITTLNDVRVAPVGKVNNNVVKLDGFADPVNLEKLYSLDIMSFTPELVNALCNRLVIPKLNTALLTKKFATFSATTSGVSSDIHAVRNELFAIAASQDAGTQKHKNIIDKYNAMLRETRTNIAIKSMNAAISKFNNAVKDYSENKTSILGSNRANRANVIDELALLNIDECMKIDCPILMDTLDACIMFKKPAALDFEVVFSNDYNMESPFEFGVKFISDLIMPGIFSYDVASVTSEHPFTREQVYGFVPLSKNPAVVMRHMSKLFGANREMWHLLRGFISAIVNVMKTKGWFNAYTTSLTLYLTELSKKYLTTKDLKGSTDAKVPFTEALAFVSENPCVYLRNRMYADNFAIMDIISVLVPDSFAKIDMVKFTGMNDTIKVFSEVHKLLKSTNNARDLEKYIFITDELGHFSAMKCDLHALIAQVLWRNDLSDNARTKYAGMKLQIAIDTAMTDTTFGNDIKKAFNGEFDSSVFTDTRYQIAYPEPQGEHFKDIPCGVYGRHTCVMCNSMLYNLMHHLRCEQGKYFFNGIRAVKYVVKENPGERRVEVLFPLVKDYLFKKYTVFNGALHTQRCKTHLLKWIKHLTE